MFAKIYQPNPSAMTSGRAKSNHWLLEFVSKGPTVIDPLTGNTRSVNPRSQIELKFDTQEEAVAYAKAHNIPHRVIESKKMKRIPRSYSDNFKYDRKLPWTH
jgi:hypothetical protein